MVRTLGNPMSPTSAEKLFVALTLFASTGAFTNLRVTGPIEAQYTGMLAAQIFWLLIYIVAIALFFRRCDHPIRAILGVAPLVAVVAFALASASWSLDPALTLRRSVALGLTIVFGVYFATCFELREQLRLLAWVCGICALFSFFFQLLGLNPSEGQPGWYGIFYVKNELGRNMAIGALVFLFWGRVEPQRRGLARAGFLASVALIALSRSMTAIIAFALVLALLPYLQWTLRRSVRLALAGTAFLLAAGGATLLYVVAHMAEVTGFVGKSATLTGRVPLWIFSFVAALRRPWLGYGFNAFWLPDATYAERIWHAMGSVLPHAHNGFLELWLELGLVGLGLFMLVLVYYIAKGLQNMRRDPGAAAAWPVAFLVFLLLENLAETAFLTTNYVCVMLYAAAAVSISAAQSEAYARDGAAGTKERHA